MSALTIAARFAVLALLSGLAACSILPPRWAKSAA